MKSTKYKFPYYRSDIDGLRGYAVIFVVLYHYSLLNFGGGFLGVDIFFVISGYLITSLISRDLNNNNFSVTNFFHRRIKRIIPLLLIVILITSFLSYFLLLPKDLKDYSRSGISSLFFFSNIYFYFRAEYFDSYSIMKPLLHTWSLSIEEQYYLFYPLLFLIFYNKYKKLLIFIIFTLFIMSVGSYFYKFNNNFYSSFYLGHNRFWEIFLGCLIFFIPKFNLIKNKYFIYALEFINLILFLLLLLICIFFNSILFEISIITFVVTILTSIIIYINNYQLKTKIIYSNKFLQYIGIRSFSLYLVHWPVLVYYYYYYENLNHYNKFFLIIFSLILSSILFKFVETPFRNNYFKVKTLYIIIIALFLFLSLFFVLSERSDGLKSRLSEDNLILYNDALELPNLKCDKIDGGLCDHNTKNTKAEFILWGDSHAFLFYDYFYNKYKDKKNSWIYASCFPVFDIYIPVNFKPNFSKNCLEQNSNLKIFLKQNKVKKILLAANWSHNILGIEKKLEGVGLTNIFISTVNKKSTNKEEAMLLFNNEFSKTINYLNKLNIEVFVLKPLPTFNYWVANKAIKKIQFNHQKLELSRPIAEYYSRNEFVNNIFDKYVKEKKIKIIDPTDVICEGINCYAFKNNLIYYSDSNHLTSKGSHKVSKLFDKIF